MAKTLTSIAQAAAEALPTAPYIVVAGRINHDKNWYLKGATVSLNVKDAARMRASKSVLAITSETTPGDVNAAIDLRTMTRDELASHAIDTYRLPVTPEMTFEDLIAAVEQARSVDR